MRGVSFSVLIVLIIFFLIVEIASYSGLNLLLKNLSRKMRTSISISVFIFGLITLGLFIFSFSNPNIIRQSENYSLFYFVIFITILNIIPKTFFATSTLFSFFFRLFSGVRSQHIVLSGSSLIALGMTLLILQSYWYGRYNIRVEKHELIFGDLPHQLDGLRIVQFSDIHLGSFSKNSKILTKAVLKINELHPDILLFTGDIVNNFANELKGYEPYLNKLSSKYEKYAILGNHDYGDYSLWPDSDSKSKNMDEIRNAITNNGFKLLLNQWDTVKIKDTSLCIIGVENWGHPPFPQYAKLDVATQNLPDKSFKILLSHDPAHWHAAVEPQTNIQLTLSGHTHGGQFGIKVAGIEFSPIYFYQKYWGGLYQSEYQKLYVNRGLGTIGFPGRVEMRPEITLLILRSSKTH